MTTAEATTQTAVSLDALVKRLQDIQELRVQVQITTGLEPETPAHLLELYDRPVDSRRRELNYVHDDEITRLADGLFIEAGQPKYSAMRELSDRGFRVVRGESDSFGWLSGLIIVILKLPIPVTVHLVFG